MESKKYNIEFLPTALDDMKEIGRYISKELKNPEAAERLADRFFEAAEELTHFPYNNPLFSPSRTDMILKHEYRKKYVRNYIILFWIEEKDELVTVAGVIYKRRDKNKLDKGIKLSETGEY